MLINQREKKQWNNDTFRKLQQSSSCVVKVVYVGSRAQRHLHTSDFPQWSFIVTKNKPALVLMLFND